MEDQDPDLIDHDIYDEIANLERWQDTLSELIANNDITQEEYDDELLKTRYYIDIRTKNYVLEDEEADLLEKLKKYKMSLTENYKMGIINETEFNKEFIQILRKEYSILRNAETEDGTKQDVDIDAPLSEKLKRLHEAEISYNKRIARKNGIEYPRLPRGIKSDEVDAYYNQKMSRNPPAENPLIEDYLKKLSETKKLIDYHTSSFEVTKLVYNAETGRQNYEFKMIAPISDSITEIKILSKRANLLTPEEQAYSDRLLNLKNNLRKIPRDELLKCIGARTFKFMSYIERLRENKQFVFKFRKNPENYEALKKILGEENEKYYKIDSNLLFKNYTYSLPDIDTSEPTEYLQKGQISYLALKENIDRKDIGDNLENFVTVKPMDDPLYLQLKDTQGSQTEIGEVWELRTSLPGSTKKELVKRYISFEDYLADLKDILVENSKKISGKSRDILNDRIRKISYYLTNNEDLENIKPSGQIPLDKLFKNREEIQTLRREGIYKIMNYITSYYPGAQILAENTERDIFNYSSANYKFNIDKVIFIFKNFSEKLAEYVEGEETILNLLTYETPNVLPEDDINVSDKEGTINTLLRWTPNTSDYDYYSSELNYLNHNFRKFKSNHLELSSLKIQEIMSQYSEKLSWERSLRKYSNLEVPEGSIETNYRLRFLLRQRNRLPSRRIYKVAKVSERINNQKRLTIVFKNCRVSEPEEYAILTEQIIVSMSKTPEDYDYYYQLISNQYKKLCNFFTKVNLSCELDSSGVVKCIDKFEPKILTPAITEFLITEGDFETADINRLRQFTEDMDSQALKDYIYSIRGDILNVYIETLKDNKIFEKAIKVLESAAREKRYLRLAEIANNIYKPPVVALEKPVRYMIGVEYTIDHIQIENTYIYGGYYPMFYQYNDSGEIIKENYTRSELEQLAILFNVTIVDDSFELYKNIMNFMSEYNNKKVKIERLNYSPVEYNQYYEYLKTSVKTINYTLRPRLGVREPGEVYTVTKDQEKKYGVPFDFNKDSIPVYSSELKQLVDDSFIIIEGPCIFFDTSPQNKLISDSYILVEYRDSRGKPKLFREGVSPKKIIKRKLDGLNTCGRFVNQESCDNPNSFSLEIDKLKFKCKWLDDRCKGVIFEEKEIKSFDINNAKFETETNKKLFESAIKIALEYIESIVKEKELSREEIILLSKEQKIRLYRYYLKLLETDKPKEEPKEEVRDNFYSIIDDYDFLTKPQESLIEKQDLDTEYLTYTIYDKKPTQMKLPLKRIILEKDYKINSLTIVPKSFNEDGTVNCEVSDTGENVTLEREEFRKTSSEIIMKTVPTFCYVHKDNYRFLKDLPGYFWYLIKEEYKMIEGELKVSTKRDIKTFIPPNFIEPSSEINGRPLITKEDIFSAISKTAFSEFTTGDEIIYNLATKINVQEDAIEFAIKNRVDVVKMADTIVGNITLPMVLEEYERLNPKKFMSMSELTDIINKAIQEEDKKTLMEYYTRARKAKLDRDLLKEARELIKTLEDPKEPEPESVTTIEQPTQVQTVVKSIYTSKRRR